MYIDFQVHFRIKFDTKANVLIRLVCMLAKLALC